MALRLDLNQIIWLEDISSSSYLHQYNSWNLPSKEERWEKELTKGEVVKIDCSSYYVMIKRFSDNTIVELDVDSPTSNKDYRLWLNKEDYIKMKLKQEEINELKSKAIDIINSFTEFELIDFIEKYN